MAELKKTYTIYKYLGETPLEALERLRTEENIPTDVPMTYAGRLDPAAEGKLLILVGEECKKKEEYTALSKTYMAEILIGVSTDSFDLLGIPTRKIEITAIEEKVKEYLDAHVGKYMQTYPPYSSKTVDGEQLHVYAREGKDVELPAHEVELFEYSDLSLDTVLSEDLLVRVGEIAAAVTGDFRQQEILEVWAAIDMPEKLPLVAVTVTVSSGFYIRQLAEDLGKELDTGACLYSLVRTEVGEYKI